MTSLLKKIDAIKTVNIDGMKIDHLAYDSRKVVPGTLFFAIPGLKYDGFDFIDEAAAAGAVAIVSENWQDELEIGKIQVKDARVALAASSAAFYGEPSESFRLIGVTGTNGKTTTSYLIERIFRRLGDKTGLIGTLECLINGARQESVRTTPESLDLQRIFHKMKAAGVATAVMEVSSHAARLNRIDACRFDAFVFTNLTRDHLDFHPDMDDYFQAKARLFRDPKFGGARHIINIDDEYGKKLCRKNDACVTYGFSPKADVRCLAADQSETGLKLKITFGSRTLDVSTRLKGIINSDNILAAVAVAKAFDLEDEVILPALSDAVNVPGRFEAIEAGQDFTVVVDYAHTPDGLNKVLDAARMATGGKLITVFGCGGDRDREKRPLMGEAVSKKSDVAIVTSDNPRSEDPKKIIDDILAGMDADGKTKVVIDRYQAIEEAIKEAGPLDLVLIAGKGHETGQIFSDKTVPFDDRDVAREIIGEMLSDNSKSA